MNLWHFQVSLFINGTGDEVPVDLQNETWWHKVEVRTIALGRLWRPAQYFIKTRENLIFLTG
jgi:hypothetical protein